MEIMYKENEMCNIFKLKSSCVIHTNNDCDGTNILDYKTRFNIINKIIYFKGKLT